MSNPFKALQTRLEFTDKQAADYLGVPVFTFKKWRDGLREPSAAVNRLLEVLGMLEAIAPAIHAAFLPAPALPSDTAKRGRVSKTDLSMSKNPD